MSTKSKRKVTIAAMLFANSPTQLLDLAPIDLFHMTSKQYLGECKLPAPLVALGYDEVNIMYVRDDGQGRSQLQSQSQPQPQAQNLQLQQQQLNSSSSETTTTPLTANAAIKVTHNLTHVAVQSDQVDILFVPGPDPSSIPTENEKAFLQNHAKAGTTVMSVCTGIYPLGYAGLLDGGHVSGPRGLVGELKKKFPKAHWVEKRWNDCPNPLFINGDQKSSSSAPSALFSGELWTSGGITNGQDMVAAYLRRHFSTELADLICSLADVGGRGQDYDSGSTRETSWWIFMILRAWWKGK